MNIKMMPRERQTAGGGILLMPLKKNVPHPRNPKLKLTKCPACGQECWERPLPDGYTEDMFSGSLCTECGLT